MKRKYNVTLTYDVTISKVVSVLAGTPEEAVEKATDLASRGKAGKDHYEFAPSDPDGSNAEPV